MKITTVKGTNDYLPREAELRTYMQNRILEVYKNAGFSQIMTPILEDIENLDKSEGGENLSLIFKVLKRGEKLSKVIAEQKYGELADIGLRYDLTLPLSRYYANNRAKLTLPMKCIQIDKAYRAENPQKGRLRELVQCDIDIIGTSSLYAEIELIYITAKALLAIGIDDFTVIINDRNLLKLLFKSFGFEDEQLDSLCVTFDKLGKIGIDGVKKELIAKELDENRVTKLTAYLNDGKITLESLKSLDSAGEIIEGLETIISTVTDMAAGKFAIEFDMTLVRGQGYYTGTVFEIESKKYKSSLAGGGRYDNLIGKFTGGQIPAVGFSIGFERIFDLLAEESYAIPDMNRKVAILYDKEDFVSANRLAEKYRTEFDVAIYEKPAKVKKFLDKLEADRYYAFCIYGKSEELVLFGS